MIEIFYFERLPEVLWRRFTNQKRTVQQQGKVHRHVLSRSLSLWRDILGTLFRRGTRLLTEFRNRQRVSSDIWQMCCFSCDAVLTWGWTASVLCDLELTFQRVLESQVGQAHLVKMKVSQDECRHHTATLNLFSECSVWVVSTANGLKIVLHNTDIIQPIYSVVFIWLLKWARWKGNDWGGFHKSHDSRFTFLTVPLLLELTSHVTCWWVLMAVGWCPLKPWVIRAGSLPWTPASKQQSEQWHSEKFHSSITSFQPCLRRLGSTFRHVGCQCVRLQEQSSE